MLAICGGYAGLLIWLRGTAPPTTRSLSLRARESTTLSDLRPISSLCKLFPYDNYYRANNFEELRALGERAKPGDMVELVAGVHEPHRAPMETTDGEGLCGTWPTRALEGTVFDLHGKPGRLITFCGDRERTIIDGGEGSNGSKRGAGIQIVRSSYVRFAGFTIRNLLRAVDIQDTTHAEVLYVTSENTWHEGFRVRYNSSSNLIQHNHIRDTGLGYVGNGEAIYVGTARGRTTDCGNPQDNSDFNVIAANVFGPNVPSENVDVKEYTHGGVIRDNMFNGTALQGIHASTSWVALKGKGWKILNNTGTGLGVSGAGFRVLQRVETFGSDNIVEGNTCKELPAGSVCIFVDQRTTNNTVRKNRVVESDYSVRVSNAD